MTFIQPQFFDANGDKIYPKDDNEEKALEDEEELESFSILPTFVNDQAADFNNDNDDGEYLSETCEEEHTEEIFSEEIGVPVSPCTN